MKNKKVILISGYLQNLSDNIIPFLDNQTDIFVHTWETEDSKRWINKLNRYKKYCNSIVIEVEKPKYSKKLYSYFYSTYKVIQNLINKEYEVVIKFKPNVEGEIRYKGDIEYYLLKGKLQSRPLLEGVEKQDCVFGTIHYQTLDERIFTTTPKTLLKCFNYTSKKFHSMMVDLDNKLSDLHGQDYEGSIFWKEWFESHNIKLIQDIDLVIPNSIK